MLPEWVKVDADTLDVTHIFEGEEVVTGGDDGQVWIATFADKRVAERFVDNAACQQGMEIYGLKRAAVGKSGD